MDEKTRAQPEAPVAGTGEEEKGEPARSRGAALLHWAKFIAQIVVPIGVVWLVWFELKTIDVRQTRAALHEASLGPLAAAVLSAGLTLGVMGLYDVVSFGSTPTMRGGHRWRLGVLIFAWTNFLTLGPIGGPALRLLFYRRAGMEPGAIVRGLGRMYGAIFTGLGGFLLASLVPLPDGLSAAVNVSLRVAMAAALAMAMAHGLRLAALRVGRLRADVPSGATVTRLVVVAMLDWIGVTTTFCLVARSLGIQMAIPDIMRALFLGHAAGMASMVPGGLGSADLVWHNLMVRAGTDGSAAAACVLLFRAVFYVLPWVTSLLVMYTMFAGRSDAVLKWQRRILAAAAGVNALVLLASTATPAVRDRLKIVNDMLPLDAVEASHAVAVVSAGIMLFLVRGLLRGYRAAFSTAVAALIMSGVAHILKGGDYEEAGICAGMLLLLLGARRAYTRRGRIPIGWELTSAAAIGSFAFFFVVGITAYNKVPYRSEMWTKFSTKAEASRTLRGAALLAGVGLVFVLRQALRPVRQTVIAPPEEIDRAMAFMRASGTSAAPLTVACGDKGAWWWHPGDGAGEPAGLAVYQRRSDKMIILGDPVLGAGGGAPGLLAALQAFADSEDLDPVFYQVSERWMAPLHEFGYTFFKLGEEAVVDVRTFTLEGAPAHGYRKTIRRVEQAGVKFEVISPPHSDEVIAKARDVSDAWLREKGVGEMQFSLGYFSPAYLQRCPLAVARDGSEQIVGFLNVLCTRPGGEVTFDLMRTKGGVADGLMEYLMLRTMEWSRNQGYAAVNLGMSPLYDVGMYRSAFAKERLARTLFEHGERIYNYRGLHQFKDKFRPVWEPRFMAYQRPWEWPSSVLAATSLIRAGSPADRRRIEEARMGRSVSDGDGMTG